MVIFLTDKPVLHVIFQRKKALRNNYYCHPHHHYYYCAQIHNSQQIAF